MNNHYESVPFVKSCMSVCFQWTVSQSVSLFVVIRLVSINDCRI